VLQIPTKMYVDPHASLQSRSLRRCRWPASGCPGDHHRARCRVRDQPRAPDRRSGPRPWTRAHCRGEAATLTRTCRTAGGYARICAAVRTPVSMGDRLSDTHGTARGR